MGKIGALFRVLKTGSKLASSVKTKKRAIWTNAIVGFLGALVAAGVAFGFKFGITPDQIKEFGEAIASIIGIAVTVYGGYNAWQTAATSESVGIPDKRHIADGVPYERVLKERKREQRTDWEEATGMRGQGRDARGLFGRDD